MPHLVDADDLAIRVAGDGLLGVYLAAHEPVLTLLVLVAPLGLRDIPDNREGDLSTT